MYSDGSKYTGEFLNNKRHGRGIFSDKTGTEYYGNFLNDEKDGEFIVKEIVPIEEAGQPNFDIKIGIYDNGMFIRWKSKFSNETATNTFIRLFKENKEMFDSMYAMILAKNLPNLPGKLCLLVHFNLFLYTYADVCGIKIITNKLIAYTVLIMII